MFAHLNEFIGSEIPLSPGSVDIPVARINFWRSQHLPGTPAGTTIMAVTSYERLFYQRLSFYINSSYSYIPNVV